MRRPVFGESILELRWDWPTVGGPEFPAVVAALGGFFVVGKDGGVGASKRFQTCQRAAIFFFLDLCPLGQGAHVPGELRVDERDRIIAIAATDAEVAYVGGDHFGFREAFGKRSASWRTQPSAASIVGQSFATAVRICSAFPSSTGSTITRPCPGHASKRSTARGELARR